jgi:hypothetical protein
MIDYQNLIDRLRDNANESPAYTKMTDEAANEITNLRSLLIEVASCGISYDAKKYLEVQIDSDLWADIQKIAKK